MAQTTRRSRAGASLALALCIAPLVIPTAARAEFAAARATPVASVMLDSIFFCSVTPGASMPGGFDAVADRLA